MTDAAIAAYGPYHCESDARHLACYRACCMGPYPHSIAAISSSHPAGGGSGVRGIFIVDSAFAYRRAAYAQHIPAGPVIHRTIPAPSSLVLVGITCDWSCLNRLVDGTFDDVIVLQDPNIYASPRTPLRYSIRRGAPNECPVDPAQRAERKWSAAAVKALRDRGICPTIEESDTPSEGIFIVHESASAGTRGRAMDFFPQYIVARPPSSVIQFKAIEVQRRFSKGAEVLAEARYYVAPGYLGFPPLIGCWERPDNIIWIMPAGDAGCGFWRRILDGGDGQDASDAAWVYSAVFTGRR